MVGDWWRRLWALVWRKLAAAPVESVLTASDVAVNLGCGDKPLKGFVNIDVVAQRADNGPDVRARVDRPLPLANESVDLLMSVHVIEHIERWSVEAVLEDWVRVLRPGGLFVVECPNLINACKHLLSNPASAACIDERAARSMWVLYGDPGWRDPFMMHQWAYTPESLAALLKAAGLELIKSQPAVYKKRGPRDMRLVARKPL